MAAAVATTSNTTSFDLDPLPDDGPLGPKLLKATLELSELLEKAPIVNVMAGGGSPPGGGGVGGGLGSRSGSIRLPIATKLGQAEKTDSASPSHERAHSLEGVPTVALLRAAVNAIKREEFPSSALISLVGELNAMARNFPNAPSTATSGVNLTLADMGIDSFLGGNSSIPNANDMSLHLNRVQSQGFASHGEDKTPKKKSLPRGPFPESAFQEEEGEGESSNQHGSSLGPNSMTSRPDVKSKSSAPETNTSTVPPVAAATSKRVISARACVVCGRDDRVGMQRQSGFKCLECIGKPSTGLYTVVVDERAGTKGHTEDGEKTMEDYTFLSDIGRGAYGKVKLVVHNKSGQTYACKVVQMKAKTTQESVLQEISILKALQHPNVCALYEVLQDREKGKYYLIMEYCEKGTIYKVDEGGKSSLPPIPIEKLRKYMVAIGRGMQYLHVRGIAHRDIKPENILCDREDHAKLTDFGVSAVTGAADILKTTKGSPAYMPPEEFDDSKTVEGFAHDIWALGITLYAMAFGKLPYWASDLTELGKQIVNTEIQYPDDADPDLVDLIQQMTHKEQANRISIREVLRHPFVYQVRTIKGQPVEAVKLQVQVAKPGDDLTSPDFRSCSAVLFLKPDEVLSEEAHAGATELSKFVQKIGPKFTIAFPSQDACTLFGIRPPPSQK